MVTTFDQAKQMRNLCGACRVVIISDRLEGKHAGRENPIASVIITPESEDAHCIGPNRWNSLCGISFDHAKVIDIAAIGGRCICQSCFRALADLYLARQKEKANAR